MKLPNPQGKAGDAVDLVIQRPIDTPRVTKHPNAQVPAAAEPSGENLAAEPEAQLRQPSKAPRAATVAELGKIAYEAAPASDVRLQALGLGSFDPTTLAQAQNVELGVWEAVASGLQQHPAQLQAPRLRQQFQILGSEVSPQYLRSLVDQRCTDALQQANGRLFRELVELGQCLDAAQSVIDDYGRTLRNTPRAQRPHNAELDDKLCGGIDSALVGVIAGLERSIDKNVPALIDAINQVSQHDSKLASKLERPLAKMRRSHKALQKHISNGARTLEGYYNVTVLSCMHTIAEGFARACKILEAKNISLPVAAETPTPQ